MPIISEISNDEEVNLELYSNNNSDLRDSEKAPADHITESEIELSEDDT